MVQRKDYHVLPNPKGVWDIKREGGERSSGHFDSKGGALSRGRDLAKGAKVELVDHRKNGTIRDSDSYGRDPNPPKDKKH